MMDGKDAYRARLEACLAEAEAATLPRVKERHLAAASSWQQLLNHAVELEQPVGSFAGSESPVDRLDR